MYKHHFVYYVFGDSDIAINHEYDKFHFIVFRLESEND